GGCGRRSTWAGVFTPATGRHVLHGQPLVVERSTWAGVFTPATGPALRRVWTTAHDAQRGPGSSPRRRTGSHFRGHGVSSAQRGPGSSPRRRLPVEGAQVVVVDRSTWAGVFTPATAGVGRGTRGAASPLN